MRILFTVDSMNGGGAERTVSTLANELSARGHNIFVVMVSYSKKESYYSLNHEINLIPLLEGFKKKPRFFKRARLLRRLIKKINPDCIIGFLPLVIIYSFVAKLGLKIPFIVSERNDPNKYKRYIQRIEKFIFKKADYCVFQTNEAMNWYGKRVIKHSEIIINPVNLTYFPATNCNRRKNNVIFTVGRLEKQKNQKLLIDAFAILTANHNDLILKLYGDGSLKNDLINYCAELGLQNVLFLNSDPHWHEKEVDSKVFVLSSDYEGMPNALIEAMALGIPCVSTDCPIGGPRYLIKNKENGYLAPTNNPKALAFAIEEALSNPKTDSSLIELLSPKKIADKWELIINKLIKN